LNATPPNHRQGETFLIKFGVAILFQTESRRFDRRTTNVYESIQVCGVVDGKAVSAGFDNDEKSSNTRGPRIPWNGFITPQLAITFRDPEVFHVRRDIVTGGGWDE
jgi:hypothetical protein